MNNTKQLIVIDTNDAVFVMDEYEIRKELIRITHALYDALDELQMYQYRGSEDLNKAKQLNMTVGALQQKVDELQRLDDAMM